MTPQDPDAAAVGTVWRWLEPSLPPMFSAADTPALRDVLDPLPLSTSRLVGFEVTADDHRPGLHLNVEPEALGHVAQRWDDARRLVDSMAVGLHGSEQGLVFEPGEQCAGYGVAAVYSGCPTTLDLTLRADLLQTWGVSPATVALVAACEAFAAASHLGVHVGRPDRPIRVVVPAAPQDEAFWAGISELPGIDRSTVVQARTYAQRIRPDSRVSVNVDIVGSTCGPVVGIEASTSPSERHEVVDQWSDPVLAADLDRMDIPRLLDWQGRRLVDVDGGRIDDTSLLRAAQEERGLVEIRLINHLKAAFRRGRRPTAKVYLSVSRNPVRWQPADPDQLGTGTVS